MTVLLPGLRKATSDERENDSGAAIELEGCHVAVGAGSSTPEDRVSICISMIATQDHAFLPSSHYNNNNLQGIQQFPLYALLNISSSQSLNYSNQPTATTNTSATNVSIPDNAQSRQYAKISVSLLSISSSFPVYELFPISPLSALLPKSTFTTKFTTTISAMGRVCLIIHRLQRPSTDFLQGGYN